MSDTNASSPPLPVAKSKPMSEALLNEKVRDHQVSCPQTELFGWRDKHLQLSRADLLPHYLHPSVEDNLEKSYIIHEPCHCTILASDSNNDMFANSGTAPSLRSSSDHHSASPSVSFSQSCCLSEERGLCGWALVLALEEPGKKLMVSHYMRSLQQKPCFLRDMFKHSLTSANSQFQERRFVFDGRTAESEDRTINQKKFTI
ncbi:hypothetical protein PV10_00952 [Exophiala mesophila]|uniref:Uncharacterized protein n=1 Tax=Exophiala mesophila TaxID=212818 RepID=A0A0D1X5V7_EXOME|nr:uncharacterized protein PV10_00952 [Exophiala mesophila]KIV97170.1 hypothetical protein PV10_00952 [Exophiala mesophila]